MAVIDEIDDLKQDVMDWSGFTLQGNTKQEMKEHLKTIAYDLENEISMMQRRIEKAIDELPIDEGV